MTREALIKEISRAIFDRIPFERSHSDHEKSTRRIAEAALDAVLVFGTPEDET